MCEGFKSCTPCWALEGNPCPYGKVLWVPTSHLTLPFRQEMSLATWLGVAFSTLPFIGMVLNLTLIAIRRRKREVCWLLFAGCNGLLQFALKFVFLQPRPRSCLTSCGMPSGHSMYALGMWTLLMHDCILQRGLPRQPAQIINPIAAAAVDMLSAVRTTSDPPLPKMQLALRFVLLSVLLPVPWARIEIGDHSLPQVLVGSGLGVMNALLCIFVVRPSVCLNEAVNGVLSALAVRFEILRSCMVRMCSNRHRSDDSLFASAVEQSSEGIA